MVRRLGASVHPHGVRASPTFRHGAGVAGVDENGEKLPEGEIEEREGALMWPERFGAREVARIKAELGPYFSSGRLQQMPVPDKGGIFQRDWWQVWEDADNKFPACDHIVVSV